MFVGFTVGESPIELLLRSSYIIAFTETIDPVDPMYLSFETFSDLIYLPLLVLTVYVLLESEWLLSWLIFLKIIQLL